jgi:hypothetical protein
MPATSSMMRCVAGLASGQVTSSSRDRWACGKPLEPGRWPGSSPYTARFVACSPRRRRRDRAGPQAENEDGQRPPRVCSADRQQRLERSQDGGEDRDHPTEGSAAHQREPGGELDDAHDDRDPAPGVEAREHVLRVVEEMSIADRGNAVDDVQRARDQQQNRNEQRPTQTSHMCFPCLPGRRLRQALYFVGRVRTQRAEPSICLGAALDASHHAYATPAKVADASAARSHPTV